MVFARCESGSGWVPLHKPIAMGKTMLLKVTPPRYQPAGRNRCITRFGLGFGLGYNRQEGIVVFLMGKSVEPRCSLCSTQSTEPPTGPFIVVNPWNP